MCGPEAWHPTRLYIKLGLIDTARLCPNVAVQICPSIPVDHLYPEWLLDMVVVAAEGCVEGGGAPSGRFFSLFLFFPAFLQYPSVPCSSCPLKGTACLIHRHDQVSTCKQGPLA